MVDVLVAPAAFALSAAVLAGSDPVDDDLRAPDVGAYVLLAISSGLPVACRQAPPCRRC